MDERFMSLSGEKDIVTMTSIKSSYIDTNAQTDEFSFRVFKIVDTTFISKGSVIPKSRLSKSTYIGLKLTERNELHRKRTQETYARNQPSH